MKKGRIVFTSFYSLVVLIAMMAICSSVVARDTEPAGHSIFVQNTVWRISADVMKEPLKKGDPVYEADTIVTGKKGSAQLVMSDGAFIAIRSNTSMRLDAYRYDKDDDGFSKSIITLLKGCFRSITGMIGKQKKENYRVKTAVANIGIRGTDHEPLYIPEPENGEEAIGEPGLYDRVYSGETYIENESGSVTIQSNHVGFVPDQFTDPTVEDTVPEVYEQFNTSLTEESVKALEPTGTDEGQISETTVLNEDLEIVTSPLSIQEPVVTSEPEPVVATEPEPEPVVATEPEPEPVVATEPEPEPVVATEPEPEPVVATEPEPEPVVTTEPEPEPVVTTEPEPEPVVTTEPEPEPVVATEPEPEPVVTTEPAPEPVVTTEPAPEPVVTTEPAPEPVVTTEPAPEPVVTTEPAPEPVVTTEPAPEPVVTTEPAPEPVVTTEPAPMVHYSGSFTWSDTVNYEGIIGFAVDETEISVDASGQPTGYQKETMASPNPEWIQQVGLVNPTSATKQAAGHYSETTIEYGTWQADTIDRTTYDGTTDSFPIGSGLAHWIIGINAGSNYLSQIVTGTQTYVFDGGTNPTNQDGIAGTINSASMGVDFSRQAVDTTLDLSVNSHDWLAVATDIPLDRGTFTENEFNPSFSVEIDGASSPSLTGQINGSFAGNGLSGIMLGYTLGDTSIEETVNGTASFYAAGQDTTVAYREIGYAATDFRTPMPPTLALHSPSAVSNLSDDGLGNLTGFDTMLPKYTFMQPGDAQVPVHLDSGAATVSDTGTDMQSGITWGRWSGTITATERVSGTAVSPEFNPQELHFIAGPEMSSPVNLPITGTQTYQFVGGTNPTDNLGNVGTLNSASLSADFTNMTVATGINATVESTTFDASSAATPIENGRYFNATHNDSLGITATGTGAGTTHSGSISGAFYGEQGGSAGVTYSLNTTDGGTINTTVSGTAAFRK